MRPTPSLTPLRPALVGSGLVIAGVTVPCDVTLQRGAIPAARSCAG